MSEPQPASVPLPRFYIAKNRTLLNGAGVDPDGALAILYNVQIKPFIKGLFRLQATVVISEPMGETHGFDESSMDKSNEYEFCPKGWVKLRVIKVVENVNAVIDADMDRSYFKKVYSTYKLSTRIPADPKKVGDKEIAKTFVQAILNPVSSSPSALTVPKAKPATAAVSSSAITPKATSSKKVASPSVTPTSKITSSTPVRQSRSRSTSGQARSASPVVAKEFSPSVVQDETKLAAAATTPVISRTPSATLKKRVTNKSTPSTAINSLPSSPTIKKVTTPLKKNPKKSQSIPPLEDATPVSALRDNNTADSASRSTAAIEGNTAEKPMIRIKFKPKVISHDNDDDDAMEVEENNNKEERNGHKSDESESDSEDDTLKKDEKKDDDNDDDDDSGDNGKGASGDNYRKDDGDSDDESVDDDSSNGSSSPPPEAEEWFTDGDEDSTHSARDNVSQSSHPPPPPPEETSVALERFPSSATTSSSRTDNTESQLKETNVSFERYMDDVTANGMKEESGSKTEAIKQYYINASKELWEKLRGCK